MDSENREENWTAFQGLAMDSENREENWTAWKQKTESSIKKAESIESKE